MAVMHTQNHFIASQNARLKALWHYRSFVLSMVWREFRGDYLGSLLGSLWAILNPMAMIFIYTVIFSKIMRARLPGVPDAMGYGMFICAGVITWGFFSELMGRCPRIFVDHGVLLKEVNFPRTTLPVIVLLSSAFNFVIIFAIFMVFLLIIGRFPGWPVLAFLPLLCIQQAYVLGFGIIMAVVNVFFRDVDHVIKIALQFWFWFTPIVYPVSILPDRVRRLIEINPMTKFITAYQDIILHAKWPDWGVFGLHTVGAFTALALGTVVFHKMAADMVDEL